MRKTTYTIEDAFRDLRTTSDTRGKRSIKEAVEAKQVRNKYTPEEYLKIVQCDPEVIDNWMDSFDNKTLKYICTGVDLQNDDGVLGFMYDDGSCYLENELSEPGYEVSEEEMWQALQPER